MADGGVGRGRRRGGLPRSPYARPAWLGPRVGPTRTRRGCRGQAGGPRGLGAGCLRARGRGRSQARALPRGGRHPRRGGDPEGGRPGPAREPVRDQPRRQGGRRTAGRRPGPGSRRGGDRRRSGRRRAASAGSAPGGAGAAKVSLGSATLEQLDGLDGIGPTLAKRIVDYRSQHGGFRSLEQLQEVDGIGEKRFQALKEALSP
ncbi:MAG: helix-hairpin-helix domain-containing protein [Thermoleophilaceae bacterium]